ncbi:MAG TPA: rod-binding protein [Bacillota bacterium]|nr:rod-binding protein [Bacillota bacterium]
MINQVVNNNPQMIQAMTPEQKKVMKACTDFEAMMIKKMLETMQSSTKMFGDGFGGDFYQSMFQDTIANQMAGQGLGIARLMYQDIMKFNISPVVNKP